MLLPVQLKVLQEYINKNLKKGFIKKSILPAGYLILFAPKKDKKLRLYIDYRQLNSITVKNRYLLSLFVELQDRFYRAKIFTKLDLYRVYNLVYIAKGEE